jgi:hypothetical protein
MNEPHQKNWPKPVTQLNEEDFHVSPVWEYDLDNEGDPNRDETWVTPVFNLPASDLENRVVCTNVILRNGIRVPAILGNISLRNPKKTKHFLTLTIFASGKQFFLARYMDGDSLLEDYGPKQCARFLGYQANEVFPIAYDISAFANGSESVVKGIIEAEPSVRLTKSEAIELALSED